MLLRTAILKQFDAELCEAMCAGSCEGESPAMSGGEFISWLNRSNLFVIALDNEGRWFRYHHLFQQLLIRLLKKEFSEAAIAALHQKASAWLDRHERVSDAIDHALASGDVRAAAQVLERQRHTVLNNDNWPLLESWIARFPEDCQPSQPAILIAKAWLANFRGAIWAIPPILEGLDSLRQNEALDPSLEGEIEFFKAVVLFWNGRIGKAWIASSAPWAASTRTAPVHKMRWTSILPPPVKCSDAANQSFKNISRRFTNKPRTARARRG
jgi:LuxR family maltose regulon positive regulatory protein